MTHDGNNATVRPRHCQHLCKVALKQFPSASQSPTEVLKIEGGNSLLCKLIQLVTCLDLTCRLAFVAILFRNPPPTPSHGPLPCKVATNAIQLQIQSPQNGGTSSYRSCVDLHNHLINRILSLASLRKSPQ